MLGRRAGATFVAELAEDPTIYVAGLLIPVPEDRMEAYRAWAEAGAAFFREYGCLEVVDCWEDFVPEGSRTDFRKAVDARPGEKIVFAWQIWPDRASFEAAERRMHEDPRVDPAAGPPFDARRLILGCFQPLAVIGRAPK